MDIKSLIEQMITDGDVELVARDPRAQFGTANRRYIGATILPERLVEDNVYEETAIRYRTIVANAGTRYSPSQLKGPNVLVGSFLVKLAEQDIASAFTARDYDALLKTLARGASMEGAAAVIKWLDVAVNRALLDLNEVYRWQAIVDALVLARGNQGYSEDIAYSNPAGHRAAAAGAWSGGGAVDPYLNISAMSAMLAGKGYKLARIITGTPVLNKILSNPFTAARMGSFTLSGLGALQVNNRTTTRAAYNALLGEDSLPPIEVNDEQYNTVTGTQFFLKRDVLVMIATTDQSEEVQVDDQTLEILPNTLGYHAIGRAAGQLTPGRVITMQHFDKSKPPRIDGEGWQTSLPVITQPEALAVIHTIT